MPHKSMRMTFFAIALLFGMLNMSWATVSDNEAAGNTLTYGMVKKHIKVGQSNQEDVVKLFGSPDNMVMRRNKEVWVYDRYRVETDTTTSSGYGTILLAGGSQSSTSISTRVKTITVIIDFTPSGVVEDLNMRVGGY
jgi:outer membrane protein assembly factor BamE (lipoprotein component of BamABCDE complex)